MTKLGLIRKSTKEQELMRQRNALLEAGVKPEWIWEETVSGTKPLEERPVLQDMLNSIRKGEDTIVLDDLTRLSRRYDDIGKILNILKEKKVELIVLNNEALNIKTGNETIDKMLFDIVSSVFALISENETKERARRQKAGIKVAKEKGIYAGRPQSYSDTSRDKQKRIVYQKIKEDLSNGKPKKQIARERGVARNTVYKIARES